MVTIGIHEFKQRASELIRTVRQNGTEIQVTYYGKVVALLIPVSQPARTNKENEAWSEIDQLATEISARRPTGVSNIENG